MACHGCATKFSMFVKEHGCPGCGFAFCSKCLRYKRVLPKLGSDVKTVCRVCFTGVPDAPKKDVPFDPPAAFLKRLEALEDPDKPPIVVYKTDTKMEKLKAGLTEEDRDIVQRLEKLREDRKKKPIPTEEEIRNRLAALKDASTDIEGAVATKKASQMQFIADQRSNTEKAHDLVQQLMEEQALSEKDVSPDDVIAERLAKLRAGDRRSGSITTDKASVEDNQEKAGGNEEESPPADSEEVINKRLKDVLREAAEKCRKKKHKEKTEEDSDSLDESDTSSVDSEDLKHVQKYLKKRCARWEKESPLESSESDDEDSKSSLGSDDLSTEEKPHDPKFCWVCQKRPTLKCLDCRHRYCKHCCKYFHGIPPYAHHRIIKVDKPNDGSESKKVDGI